MNRTQEEIVARINERKAHDYLGFEIPYYMEFLDWGHVQSFLKDGHDLTKDEWLKGCDERKAPEEAIKDYMPFAFEKANGCRGISAARSLAHMVAWLWLAGENELAESTDGDYEHYGKEKLIKICEHYKLDWKQWDDGERTNTDH